MSDSLQAKQLDKKPKLKRDPSDSRLLIRIY